MVTVKTIFRTDKSNNQNEHPIYLRIIKNRKPKYISLGIFISEEQWDEDEKKVKKHPNAQQLNNYITAKKSEAEGVALQMVTSDKYAIPEKIKDEIMGKASVSFTKFSQRYLEELDNGEHIATHKKTKSILLKISEFTNGKDLHFDYITVSWLKEFEQFLKKTKGNGANTVNANFRVIRRIINLAINEDLINIDRNPFKRLKLTSVNPKKDYLTEQELKWMELAPIAEGTNKDHHRNMYVFSAYAGGLRISDMLLLKWKNFDGTRIIMQTQKTASTVSIKLPVTALEILKKYRADDSKSEDFIFPFLKNNDDYTDKKKLFNAISSATAYTNGDLKDIAKMVGIEKKLSFHSARHTFATRALMKGMRIEYVSKLLGHSDIATTQIYAKIVNEELDKAMDVFN